MISSISTRPQDTVIWIGYLAFSTQRRVAEEEDERPLGTACEASSRNERFDLHVFTLRMRFSAYK